MNAAGEGNRGIDRAAEGQANDQPLMISFVQWSLELGLENSLDRSSPAVHHYLWVLAGGS